MKFAYVFKSLTKSLENVAQSTTFFSAVVLEGKDRATVIIIFRKIKLPFFFSTVKYEIQQNFV